MQLFDLLEVLEEESGIQLVQREADQPVPWVPPGGNQVGREEALLSLHRQAVYEAAEKRAWRACDVHPLL
jgi:hypothetical protein